MSQTKSFEAQLKDIEVIANKMESKDLDLASSIKLYEEGVALVQECQKTLQNAELTIDKLNEKMTKVTQEDEAQ